MNLPLFIAGRYLISKKSHNVINKISAISAAGMAVGTAALIIILSVYNGFDSLVKSMMSNIEPDLEITPSQGKVFVPDSSLCDWIYGREEISTMCTVLRENVFINYGGKQSVATAQGVDRIYEEETPLRNSIRSGVFSLRKGEIPQAVVGASLAYKMGINPDFVDPLQIYYPDREAKISLINPQSSINFINVWPSGLVSVNSDIDDKLIVLSMDKMRELLGYEDEVSAIELRVKKECSQKDIKSVQKAVQQQAGEKFLVRDRYEQNTSLYKMMKYEKAFIFLILFFVVLIIGFNIYGSLSMLIIEKKDDIRTYKALGTPDNLVRKIFILEGWLVSLTGLAAGLVVGLGFALAQQKFGFIKMPGNFVVSPYPVIIEVKDILLTIASVATIGYVVALLPVKNKIR